MRQTKSRKETGRGKKGKAAGANLKGYIALKNLAKKKGKGGRKREYACEAPTPPNMKADLGG